MLKGYSPPANFRREINQQGGGVAIFVKSGIDHKISIHNLCEGILCMLYYCGWTMSIDFRMDRCLQSIAHQSHSVDADWSVKYR